MDASDIEICKITAIQMVVYLHESRSFFSGTPYERRVC